MADKTFIVKNGLEVGGQEVVSSSGVVTSAALGGQTLASTDSPTFNNLTLTNDIAVGGDLNLTGDLNITGDINSLSVTDLDVTDQTITLGAGQVESASGGSGIVVDGSGASILWDETNTEFDINNSINVTGTITSSGNITGTLATAAQPNITSVGTLTALTGGTGDLNWDSGTLFVDSSANSVGIGTSLPDADLHVEGVTRTKYLRFQNLTDATSEVAGMYSSSGGGTNDLSIYASALSSTSSNIKFLTAPTNSATTTTLFLEGSSGNVGIGTSSPSNYYTGADNLVVYQATGEVGMTIATGNSSVGALYFADGTTGVDEYKGGIAYEHSADLLSLVSGGATKIRIDATGNTYPNVNASWDLGKTTSRFKDLYLSGTASVGHVIPNTQGTYSINHLGVYSGGITVNAATSQTGYLMSAGTGIVGFGPNGGSIRLGGTAAANELDDYEEGTWTP